MCLKLKFDALPSQYANAVGRVVSNCGAVISDNGMIVKIDMTSDRLKISGSSDGYILECSDGAEMMRGIALLCDTIQSDADINISEKRIFNTCGIMLDVSRGFVFKKETVFDIIERMAAMGYNMLMLYTEDTFEMEKYPWFGYLRGAYTKEELKEIDSYALSFGIEVIPCIQTLGHLTTALRWPEAADIRDTANVLLIGEDATYEFIEEMFITMRECFSSDRIHIGMDEAFGVGTGNYLKKNPPKNVSDLMCEHLTKVCTIARKYNYKPMMWSDMFFRLNGETADYDPDAVIPGGIHTLLPENIEMVYWDYATEDTSHTGKIIDKHSILKRDVIYSSGIASYNRLCPSYKKSYDTNRCQLKACADNNINTVFATVWNNPHSDISIYSVLPAMQMYMELCYDTDADEEKIAKRFKSCCGYELNSWMSLFADDFTDDEIEKFAPRRSIGINSSYQIFFSDILLGIMDKTLSGYDFKSHYRALNEKLASADSGDMADVFKRAETLYDILYIKSDIAPRLRAAYRAKDKPALTKLADELRELLALYEQYHRQNTDMWFKLCKPFGYNWLDEELGGMESRIKTAIIRIEGYINKAYTSLPELECDIKYYNGNTKPFMEVGLPAVFARVF